MHSGYLAAVPVYEISLSQLFALVLSQVRHQ
jgi:hypothetical protein